MELKVFLHGVDVVENIIDNSGDDSLHGWVVDDTLHGVGLARGGLSISKYGSIVTTQNICKHKKINISQAPLHLENAVPLTIFLAVASYTCVWVTFGFKTLSNM